VVLGLLFGVILILMYGVVVVFFDKDFEGILVVFEFVFDDVVIICIILFWVMDFDDFGEVVVEVFGEDCVYVVSWLFDVLVWVIDLVE